VQAELAQKFIAPWIDHYLAWKSYHWQQTEYPVHTVYPNNGPYSVQGSFNKEAKSASLQFWFNRHRSLWAVMGLCLSPMPVAESLVAKASPTRSYETQALAKGIVPFIHFRLLEAWESNPQGHPPKAHPLAGRSLQ